MLPPKISSPLQSVAGSHGERLAQSPSITAAVNNSNKLFFVNPVFRVPVG